MMRPSIPSRVKLRHSSSLDCGAFHWLALSSPGVFLVFVHIEPTEELTDAKSMMYPS